MSWRDRAIKVTESEPTRTSSWRERAIPVNEPSFASKANNAALNIVKGGLETISAPVEVAGEVVRGVIENPLRPLDDFRQPSIVQRIFPSTKTKEPPAFIVDTANKLLRGAAGAADSAIKGKNVVEGARSAYNSDRGLLGAVEDTAGSLILGRLAPQVLNAPNEAASKILSGTIRGANATGKIAANVGKKAAKVGIRAALGPTATEQSLLFNRPGDVKNAKDIEELSNNFANKINDLSSKVGKLDSQAWDKLLKLKSEPRSKILKALKSVRKEFIGTGKAGIGDADKKAVDQIDRYIKRLSEIKQKGVNEKLDQMLDQRQLKEIVQSIRNDTRFDLPETDPANRAVQSAQAKIDAILKENGNYKEVMDELAPATRTLKEAASHFNLKRVQGVGFVPSNTTASKLSLALGKNKVETKALLDRIKNQTGVDFADEVLLSNTKKSFTPGIKKSEGSRRTWAGTLIGTMLEPFIPGFGSGPTVGGALGFLSDYYGGAVAGKGIDAARSTKTNVDKLLSALNDKKNQASQTQVGSLLELIKRNPALIKSLNLDTNYQ